MNLFHHQLKQDAITVETRLAEVLSLTNISGEICRPKKLMMSLRHAALNGGKRLRPFLVMQTGRLFGANQSNLLQIATALECIHCYSLVHDDLPAMDDDDLRRGKPTVHKAFDEATAILAGDGLLTLAFDILSDNSTHNNPQTRITLISKLAKAAGIGGMVGGQMLDLYPESKSPDFSEIARMQAMKTGALIKFACEAGGICGEASITELNALSIYGQAIGQAFQLADDILDVTATESQLGKGTGKDDKQGKQTQLSSLGLKVTGEMAKDLVSQACESVSIFGERSDLLVQAAHFIVSREN
ncbi:MAG: polyprenyl synthetase family protein [Hyphomicrobiales bacterium]|nr:polyprenyl synthetase family protein [Hyphomicrobiales bacterium]